MSNLRIGLWHFPEPDFPAWRELVATPEVDSYAAYTTMLAAVEADQERQGIAVVRVRRTVAEMRAALAAKNLPNTPDGRAAVVAKWTTDEI